jgi:hypothetical protein
MSLGMTIAGLIIAHHLIIPMSLSLLVMSCFLFHGSKLFFMMH